MERMRHTMIHQAAVCLFCGKGTSGNTREFFLDHLYTGKEKRNGVVAWIFAGRKSSRLVVDGNR